jgi:hypothetical protein
VWSNSTLENVGSELVTNGTAWTGATGATKPNDWTQHTAATWTIDSSGGSGAEPALKVEHNGTNNNPAMHQIATTVVGKLYKMSVKVKKGTASYAWLRLGTAVQGSQYTYWANNSGSWDTLEYVFEATTTTTYLSFEATTSSTGQYSHIDTASIYEVTPGCVAADSKAFDGWFKNGGSVYPDLTRVHNDGGTLTHDGSFYALKFVSTETHATTHTVSWPSPQSGPILQQFAGRTVTLGAWIKADTIGIVKLGYYDNTAGHTVNSVANTTTSWEWMEFTFTVTASPTNFWVNFAVIATGKTVYISQPMLVFGSSIGEGNYTRPQGEIVWFDNRVNSNTIYALGYSDVAATTLNLEADSEGAIPKGAKAVSAQFQARDSASASTTAFFSSRKDAAHSLSGINARPTGRADNSYEYSTGWTPCNSDGDFEYQLEASGSGTLDAYLIYVGVELR